MSEAKSEVLIRAEGVSKVYGATRAVDNISFELKRGEVLGFLGPNGAGKTTTMKILTCFMAPTSGRAFVGGLDVYTESLEVRKKIGYLPEDNPLYPDMTPLEYLEFVAAVRDIPAARRRERIAQIGRVCGLSDVAGRPIVELSKGFRQRVGLAQALLHDPEIIILDEPTSGLDPNQIAEIRTLIGDISREKTIILSTHILPEVQATCGRVIIIHDGRLVADGTPEELRRAEQGNRYHVLLDAPPADAGDLLSRIDGVTQVERNSVDGAFQVSGRPDVDLRRPLFRCAVDRGWTLLELRRETASLEDAFRKITRE
jgi:gliding motility-associated transport system ATP-binding protein